MLFSVVCIDKPGSAALRAVTRADHLDYMIAAAESLRYGGPLVTDDGSVSIGSLFVIELPTRRDVGAFLAEEPYCRSGLFQTVTVTAIRQMVPEASPGLLRQELARERAGRPSPPAS